MAAAAVWGFMAACNADAGGARTPAIVLAPAQTPQASFEVRGLRPDVLTELRKLRADDPRWPQILAIYVGARHTADQPPMLGSRELTDGALRFQPRFPLERGIEYRAVFVWPIAAEAGPNSAGVPTTRVRLAQTFVVPVSRTGPPARVLAVYPSGRELPENLLRFYVQFSAPMSQGGSYGHHVRLRDETAGTDVVEPFLELPQELWNPDGTRLTLLLEPGRVKHGLVPRKELGPILISGRTYTLTIDASWPDADGHPLREMVEKRFRATKADATQPDPRSWTIETPPARSRERLSVRFPKPLDRAMLERVLRVVHLGAGAAASPSAARSEVGGTVHVAGEETRWSFEPREPWEAGRYALVVSTILEDPAGNSVGRPFEVDLKRSRPLPPAPAVVQIEFDVRERP